MGEEKWLSDEKALSRSLSPPPIKFYDFIPERRLAVREREVGKFSPGLRGGIWNLRIKAKWRGGGGGGRKTRFLFPFRPISLLLPSIKHFQSEGDGNWVDSSAKTSLCISLSFKASPSPNQRMSGELQIPKLFVSP